MNPTNNISAEVAGDIPGINLLPPEYRGTVIFLVIIFPYLTRGWHALKLGGGLVGVWRAIMFGTNVPKNPPTA